MEFKVRSSTPSQYRSPARQFFAEHGGIVLTTLIVIICICIVIRAQLSNTGEEETGPAQNALFDPLPDQQRSQDFPAAPHSPSSLDARPVWGMAPPAEDGGPIEGEKQPEKLAEVEKPPEPPPGLGTGGLAIPNFPIPPVEEVKKRLPKPSGTQQGSSRSVGGGGSYQPVSSPEDKERKEAARGKAASVNQALGIAPQAGKPNLTRGRQMNPVDKGISSTEALQKTGVQKEVLFTLQQIGQQVQQRTLDTGTPATITADEARSIERALGISQGTIDKKPSPNANQ
ncbi:MAG: hypothetical protein WC728_03035 [Elusimicrobiota bacterium]